MSVEGNLDLFQLPEILQLIAQQQKTGILTVQGQEDIVAISFLSGKIVAADALNQSAEEGLKEVLVSTGLLTATDFARAAAEQLASGQRLLDLLVERRYLSRPRLLEALRVQTRQLLEKLLDWREGDFKFYTGDEVSYEEGFVPIRVDELLLHAGETKRKPGEERSPAPVRRLVVPSPAAGAGPQAPRSPQPGSAAPLAFEPPPPAARPPEPPRGAVVVPFPKLESSIPGIRQMTLEPSAVPNPLRHAGRTLGALLALGLLATLLIGPGRIFEPFTRMGVRAPGDLERRALFLKIDRAAKTFFLLEGRFPERLSALRDLGLLSRPDAFDGEGRPLSFNAGEKTYELRSQAEGGTVEGISRNFLLDPEFLTLRSNDSPAPLVLLD